MSEWVLVPKEATDDMIKAGENWSGLPSATWSDMVDAAPTCDEDQTASFVQEAYDQGVRDKQDFIGWKTIETVPQDGTDVLVCVTHNLDHATWETLQWVDSFQTGFGWLVYPSRIDLPFEPTHWMPLPNPPEF